MFIQKHNPQVWCNHDLNLVLWAPQVTVSHIVGCEETVMVSKEIVFYVCMRFI